LGDFELFQLNDFSRFCALGAMGALGHFGDSIATVRSGGVPDLTVAVRYKTVVPRKSRSSPHSSASAAVASSSPVARRRSIDPLEGERVLMIASEAVPFAKTGGLADVLGALPQALARLGWDVTIALPRYRGITRGSLVDAFSVTLGSFTRELRFFAEGLDPAVHALFVDCPELYDRDYLYGVDNTDYPDNPRRFAMLVRGALEFVARHGVPTLVHAHDWQAGLAPVYLHTRYGDHPSLGRTASVVTIHNLAYQGLFDADWLTRLDLPPELFAVEELEYWGRISFLKGGINHADMITTVSPTYAREIQTPELGFGFDGILRNRRERLAGILNGIDTETWDPANDADLPRPFDATDPTGKAAAKIELLSHFRLPKNDDVLRRPVIAMISRMVDQKGFDLIAALSDDLVGLDATFIILGTGEPRYQDMWTRLAGEHPTRIAARIGFDEALAHLIEAGADIFLMPSRFEPCGLNQMYSLRYGTVPVVHGVGGLADTVSDYRPGNEAATGFVFTDYTPRGLLDALERALKLFTDRRRWRALQVAGMKQDHSWDRSAREYVKIYQRAVASKMAAIA
jgi:starch synthase